MPREKPPIHGRDHRPGGADPMPLDGFLHWGTNNDDSHLGLVLNAEGNVVVDADTNDITETTAQGDITIETTGADVGQQVRITSGGQINSIATSQNLLEGSTVIIDAGSSVLIESASLIQVEAPSIEERFISVGDRWRVANPGGSSLIEATGGNTVSVGVELNMTNHLINFVQDPTSAQDAATKHYVDAAVGSGAVSSVFGRSGAVVAVSGDYAGVVASFLTGATAASRYVGSTTSGAPVSGTFATGDFVIARDGHLFVCVTGGSPGTWADVASGAFATPSITLGSSAAAGSAGTVIRSDSTIAAFDATAPTTQAFGDAAAVGSAAFAARRDHKHAMPATPVTSINKTGSAALTGPVTVTGGANITLTQTGSDIAIAASSGGGGGGGFVASDVIWDAKGDLAAGTGADAASRVAVGSNYQALYADSSATPGVAWYPGAPILLYDYEISGSDKQTIDTGADTPQAGIAGTAAFPTTGLRVLEVFFYVRGDDSPGFANVNATVNNSGSSIYDLITVGGINGTVSAGPVISSAKWVLLCAGAGFASGVFSTYVMTFPNYVSTVGNKHGNLLIGTADTTSSQTVSRAYALGFRSTSALTRLAFAADSTKKFKVGTRLMVYAR